MWSFLENVSHALEKNEYSAVLGYDVLYTPLKSIWSDASFKATVFLLIYVSVVYPLI